MKHILNVALASLALLGGNAALAASQDECAIWLCLPQGFAPAACGPAHSAMHERIVEGKGPLPDLSECGGNNGTYTTTMAGYTPPHQVCDMWGDSCTMAPGSISDTYGGFDSGQQPIPKIQVVMQGQPVGEPFFYYLTPLSNQMLDSKAAIVQYLDQQYYNSLNN